MENQNNNIQKKIRDVVFSEASLVAVIFGVVFSIFSFFLNPVNELKDEIIITQKDVEVIKTNHLFHIEEDIEELKECYKESVKTQSEIKEMFYQHIIDNK